MPVGLGEVASYHEVLLAECVKHIPCYVTLRIVLERLAMCYAEVGILRVVHAEAVVMLGCEYHVFHACVLHHVSPLVGIKLRRIELVLQSPIPFLIVVVRQMMLLARYPVYIFRTDTPRLHNARYAVESPVHQHSKLLVLPLVELVKYLLVCRPFISVLRRLFVYKSLHFFLCI